MQNIITIFLIVTTALTVYWWTNRQGNKATTVSPEVTLLKNNVVFAILGYVCGAMFLGLIALVGFVGLGKGEDFWYSIASLAVFLPSTGFGCFLSAAHRCNGTG